MERLERGPSDVGGRREPVKAGGALPVGRDGSVGAGDDGGTGAVANFGSDLGVAGALAAADGHEVGAESVAGDGVVDELRGETSKAVGKALAVDWEHDGVAPQTGLL